MALPSLHVCNLSRARRIKRQGWTGVLTLADPGQKDVLRFHRHPCPEHLIIRCEDLDEPMPGFITPTELHAEQIIEFGRRHLDGTLLIQCNAGISRSTAVALAILADRLGPGLEQTALDQVLLLQPEAVPNLLLVMFADTVLNRDGELTYALASWDTPRSWNRWRREANRIATLFDGAIPLPPWPAPKVWPKPTLETLQRENALLERYKQRRPEITSKMGWYLQS